MRHILIALAIIFTGCSTSQFAARDAVVANQDEFSSKVTYLGITKQAKTGNTIGDKSYNYFFRSWKEKDSKFIAHQIYVNVYYTANNWKFFKQASFKGGEQAEFTKIGSDVTCVGYGICSYNEIFGITVPDEYMRQNSEGFSVKAYSQSGDELIVNLTKNQVGAQLWKVDNQ